MSVKYNTYVAYSNDEYALPVFVTESIQELACFLGCTPSYLWRCLYHDFLCKGYEVKSYAIVMD